MSSTFGEALKNLAKRVDALHFAGERPESTAVPLDPLRDPNSPAISFLGGGLGVGATNWYLWDGGTDLVDAGDFVSWGARPIYLHVYAEEEGSFLYDIAEGSGRPKGTPDLRQLRAEIMDGNFARATVRELYEWFLTGRYVWSDPEYEHRWVLIQLPEVALYQFEYAIRQTYAGMGLSRAEAVQHARSVDGRGKAQGVWEALAECLHEEHSSVLLSQKVAEWIATVRKLSQDQESAWHSWRTRQDLHGDELRDWWLDDDVDPDKLVDAGELAIAIFARSEYQLGASGEDENLIVFEQRCRFQPIVERALRSRNILMLPLWFGETDFSAGEPAPRVSVPYTAFVICNLFDARVAYDDPSALRAVFSACAQAEIIEFGTRQRERLLNVERFAGAAMTHQIRQPLAVIRTNAENTLLECKRCEGRNVGEPDQRLISSYVADIYEGVRIADQKITDALKCAGLKPLDFADGDVVAVCDMAFAEAMLEDVAPDVTVNVDGLARVPLYGDQQILAVIIAELITNAVWGIRDVQKLEARDGVIVLRSSSQENQTTIEISDNGIGIRPEEINDVWRPGFTTKSTGDGVGLPMVEYLVKAHGGNVNMNSEYRTGVIITLRLPAVQGATVNQDHG